MRFSRFPKIKRQAPSKRRLAAAAKAIERERNRAGMFADQLGPRETPEERIARQDAAWVAHWQQLRDYRAQCWREGRRLLFSLPPEQRRQLREEWRTCGWPGDAAYFLTWLKRQLGGYEYREVSVEELRQAAFAAEKYVGDREMLEGQMSLF